MIETQTPADAVKEQISVLKYQVDTMIEHGQPEALVEAYQVKLMEKIQELDGMEF